MLDLGADITQREREPDEYRHHHSQGDHVRTEPEAAERAVLGHQRGQSDRRGPPQRMSFQSRQRRLSGFFEDYRMRRGL